MVTSQLGLWSKSSFLAKTQKLQDQPVGDDFLFRYHGPDERMKAPSSLPNSHLFVCVDVQVL